MGRLRQSLESTKRLAFVLVISEKQHLGKVPHWKRRDLEGMPRVPLTYPAKLDVCHQRVKFVSQMAPDGQPITVVSLGRQPTARRAKNIRIVSYVPRFATVASTRSILAQSQSVKACQSTLVMQSVVQRSKEICAGYLTPSTHTEGSVFRSFSGNDALHLDVGILDSEGKQVALGEGRVPRFPESDMGTAERGHVSNSRYAFPSPDRVLDIVVASLALVFFAPLMIFIAAAVALSGPGPVFFRQDRLGRGGRKFSCLKFRTMRVDSEAILAELLASDSEARAEWARDQKLRNDPRIFTVADSCAGQASMSCHSCSTSCSAI